MPRSSNGRATSDNPFEWLEMTGFREAQARRRADTSGLQASLFEVSGPGCGAPGAPGLKNRRAPWYRVGRMIGDDESRQAPAGDPAEGTTARLVEMLVERLTPIVVERVRRELERRRSEGLPAETDEPPPSRSGSGGNGRGPNGVDR